MADNILKEAFDKLTAIEEGDYEDYKEREDAINKQHAERGDTTLDYVGGDDQPYDRYTRHDDKPYDLEEGSEEDVKLHDAAIDLLDDMLFALDKNDQYGEKGNILRYAIGRLQQVGLGR